MKRVILKQTYCGAGGVFPAGREVELEDREAASFIENEYAAPVKPPVKAKQEPGKNKK
jgi:hypothetical protein